MYTYMCNVVYNVYLACLASLIYMRINYTGRDRIKMYIMLVVLTSKVS